MAGLHSSNSTCGTGTTLGAASTAVGWLINKVLLQFQGAKEVDLGSTNHPPWLCMHWRSPYLLLCCCWSAKECRLLPFKMYINHGMHQLKKINKSRVLFDRAAVLRLVSAALWKRCGGPSTANCISARCGSVVEYCCGEQERCKVYAWSPPCVIVV